MDMFQMDDDMTINTTSNERIIQASIKEIERLFVQYESDLFMTSKIHHYITEQLPSLLKTMEVTREKNKKRNMEHQGEQEKFITMFLNRHRYYYNLSNERFFHYENGSYHEISEDAILHHIVSSISDQKNDLLMNRKHQTKVMLLKRIKDQSILKAIPESVTIQRVLHYLSPMLCSTKTETKYFLTILGDNLLKKHGQVIHYISSLVKPFLVSLNQISVEEFHIQCTLSFKHKYHEKHDEDLVRLVKIQPHWVADNWDETRDQIRKFGLDVLCVACHYSRKYGSADDYVLEYSNDSDLQDYVFRLKQRNANYFISDFAKTFLYNRRKIDECPVLSCSTSPQEENFLQQQLQSSTTEENKNLSWSHIQYLWKTYLESNQYPSGMYCYINKKILIDVVFPGHYNASLDVFEDVGSTQWPLIQKFLKFWDETVQLDVEKECELEVDEIGQLFRRWLYRYQKLKRPKYLLKDSQIIDILMYFYPDLLIENNKYVMNVRCSMWDKEMDMQTAIDQWRLEENEETNSVHKAYQYYTKYHHEKTSQEEGHKRPLLVSKKYFERFFQGELRSP